MSLFFRVSFFLLLFYLSPTWAHNMSPSLLSIKSLQNHVYEVSWKQPVVGSVPVTQLQFPANCDQQQHQQAVFGNVHWVKFQLRCDAGLIGQSIGLLESGIPKSSVFIVFSGLDGGEFRCTLGSSNMSCTLGVLSIAEQLKKQVVSGVVHILIGVDHLFFLFCIILVSHSSRRLVLNILAFTLGHSISLALVSLGYMPVFEWVEFAIAFSIFFMACEASAIKEKQVLPLMSAMFCVLFGFLHGMGFASVLDLYSISHAVMLPVLLAFNLGIEIGQLLFVALVMAVFVIAKRTGFRRAQGFVVHSLLVVIGSASVFWMLERAPF